MTMFLKMFNKIRNINSSNVFNQSVYQYNDKTLLQQLAIDLHLKKPIKYSKQQWYHWITIRTYIVFTTYSNDLHYFGRAAVVIREENLKDVVEVLKSYSMERIYQMRRQARFFWENYFHSIKAITETTLQIINDRVFPYVAKKYEEWNEIPNPVSISLHSLIDNCYIVIASTS